MKQQVEPLLLAPVKEIVRREGRLCVVLLTATSCLNIVHAIFLASPYYGTTTFVPELFYKEEGRNSVFRYHSPVIATQIYSSDGTTHEAAP